ncbi:MAG: matrixin family metalloprotease [Deltaproteobacteria bacterium]|nr:matrixin family metalloprotease [Deltaproteobacteria bacterium]
MKRAFATAAFVVVVGAACAPELEDHGLRIDLSPGMLASEGGVDVEVPAAGLRVWSELIFADGTTKTLDVLTNDDGLVHVIHEDAGVSSSAGVGSPTPCSDRASSLMGHHWEQRFDWWFRAGSTPGEVSVANAELALRRATTNITRTKNSCGLEDQVTATQLFQGRTTTATQIRTSGGCNAGDGKNVVDFGDLPAGVLGVACVWSFSDGRAAESDVRLNKADFSWTTATGSGCGNRYDIESVMTHERGHTFGLGHVDESSHGRLTMSTQINGACQGAERTLGRGDVDALRALY